jgi:hypothetical protein
VARLRRADEVVVGDVEGLQQREPRLGDELVDPLLRVTPFAAAARSIFCPCSSVPVSIQVSSPAWRCQRASVSTATVVYPWPMCGSRSGSRSAS